MKPLRERIVVVRHFKPHVRPEGLEVLTAAIDLRLLCRRGRESFRRNCSVVSAFIPLVPWRTPARTKRRVRFQASGSQGWPTRAIRFSGLLSDWPDRTCTTASPPGRVVELRVVRSWVLTGGPSGCKEKACSSCWSPTAWPQAGSSLLTGRDDYGLQVEGQGVSAQSQQRLAIFPERASCRGHGHSTRAPVQRIATGVTPDCRPPAVCASQMTSVLQPGENDARLSTRATSGASTRPCPPRRTCRFRSGWYARNSLGGTDHAASWPNRRCGAGLGAPRVRDSADRGGSDGGDLKTEDERTVHRGG